MHYADEVRTAVQQRSAEAAGYLPAIDGLRAVSILLVLIYHIDKDLIPGGFIGVDVFFVVSGFVVSKSVDGLQFKGITGFLAYFYRRRIVRIVPALLFFLLLFTVLSVLFTPIAGGSRATDIIGLSAFFGLSNFTLWHFSGDYFANGPALNPFTHTWSLGVEEQFYLLFPTLAFFLFAVSRPSVRTANRAFSVLVAVVLISLLLAVILTRRDPSLAFFLLPTRLWELGCGVLLYVILSRKAEAPGPPGISLTGILALLLALGLVTLAAYGADPGYFPFPWALPAVAFALLVLTAVVLWPESPLVRLLALPPLVYLGRISYSLYLAHFGIVVLFRWTYGLESVENQIMAGILSLLLGMLSYYLIETPIRRSPRVRRVSDPKVLMLGACLIVASTAIAAGIFQFRPQLTLSTTGDREIWGPAAESDKSFGDCLVRYSETGFPGGQSVRYTPESCAAPARTHHIAVIGDSHAWAYSRMLQAAAGELGAEVQAYRMPGCPLYKFWWDKPNPVTGRCAAQRESVLMDFARGFEPGDILFLPALRTPRYEGGPVEQAPETSAMDLEFGDADRAEAEAIFNEFAPLLDAGMRIVVEGPKPVFKTQAFRCADSFTHTNPECVHGFEIPRSELEARRSRTLKTIEYFASLSPNISIWDPFTLLCPGENCSLFDDNGMPLFYDNDHLSGYANDLLLEPFVAHVRELDTS
ncbi:acyltransferase family protein [Amaricoccus macauensis]|uniref:acyltransferase family protein n=1 Tax=Amaricoccus macauensis TaxID=57001 RepID=UPI003C7B0647